MQVLFFYACIYFWINNSIAGAKHPFSINQNPELPLCCLNPVILLLK